MNQNEIIKLLREIETSLSLLKKEIGLTAKTASIATPTKKQAKKAQSKGSTAPMQRLLDEKFFDQPKSDLEVVAMLKKKALVFPRQDISSTLRRMVLKELLEREGSGTKEDPWRYVKA